MVVKLNLPQPFLTDREVATLLGTGLHTMRRNAKDVTIPAPIKLADGQVRWRVIDLTAWLHEGKRLAGR